MLCDTPAPHNANIMLMNHKPAMTDSFLFAFALTYRHLSSRYDKPNKVPTFTKQQNYLFGVVLVSTWGM